MSINGKAFARQWMGKVVKATHEVRNHEVRKRYKPVVGWVVGYTYRRRGKTVFEDEVGYVFESRGPGTLVVLVCPWPGRKLIDVPFDHIELTDENPALDEWLAEAKVQMSNLMKNWPRDPSGKWLQRR